MNIYTVTHITDYNIVTSAFRDFDQAHEECFLSAQRNAENPSEIEIQDQPCSDFVCKIVYDNINFVIMQEVELQ